MKAAPRIRLAAIADVAPNTAQRIDVDGQRIALVRIEDDFYAIGDECSHADYSLAEGELDLDECAIECPKHGSLFSLADGSPLTLPATRPVPVFDVDIEDGVVYATLRGTA